MSSNSQKSSASSSGKRGIPVRCLCGGDVTIFTSTTQENPGRPFYRCVTKKNDHLFKWVEESLLEEVEDVKPKIANIESEVYNLKAEVEVMKGMLDEFSTEVMRCKRDFRKWNVVFGGCCILMIIVIIYLIYLIV